MQSASEDMAAPAPPRRDAGLDDETFEASSAEASLDAALPADASPPAPASDLSGPLPLDHGVDHEAEFDTAQGDTRDLSLQIDDSDALLAVWIETHDTVEAVQARRFEPGSGWSAVTTLSDPELALGTRVFVAYSRRSGAALIVWTQGTELWACQRTASAEAFGAASMVAATAYDELVVNVAIADSGLALITWRNASAVLGTDNRRWWAAERASTAGAWNELGVIVDTPTDELQTRNVYLTGTATEVALVWGSEALQSRWLSAAGWTEPQVIPADPPNGQRVSWVRSAALPDGGLVTFWHQNSFWVSFYDRSAGSWSQGLADPQPYLGEVLALDVTPSGYLQLLTDTSTSTEYRYVSHQVGSGVWGPERVTFNVSFYDVPVVYGSFGTGGHGAFAWTESTTSQADDLYLQRLDPAANVFGEAIALESQSNWVHTPRTAVDSTGKVFILWCHFVSGQRVRGMLRVVP